MDKMACNFDENILFKNIQNGQTNLPLRGLTEFQQQAEQAKMYFSERRQAIESFGHTAHQFEIEMEYFAILAMDFPNDLKKGRQLRLTEKSIFTFAGNKIIQLTDISYPD